MNSPISKLNSKLQPIGVRELDSRVQLERWNIKTSSSHVVILATSIIIIDLDIDLLSKVIYRQSETFFPARIEVFKDNSALV